MQSLTLHTRVGKDGILKLETPIKNLEVKTLFFVQGFLNTKDTKYTKVFKVFLRDLCGLRV
jgi:hypothetical protein